MLPKKKEYFFGLQESVINHSLNGDSKHTSRGISRVADLDLFFSGGPLLSEG